jgi:Tol biopolymer transport system component
VRLAGSIAILLALAALAPAAQAAVPRNGLIAYTAATSCDGEIWLLDEDGRRRHVTTGRMPSWSPDGKWLAFMRSADCDRDQDPAGNLVYVVRADGSGLRRVSAVGSVDSMPVWSPSGDEILVVRYPQTTNDIDLWLLKANGAGERRVTGPDDVVELGADFSPDGGRIVYARFEYRDQFEMRHENSDLWTIGIDGSDARPLMETPDFEVSPAWSPDGESIAFSVARNESSLPPTPLTSWGPWFEPMAIGTVDKDGGGAKLVTDGSHMAEHVEWSPDSQLLAYTRSVRPYDPQQSHDSVDADIYTLSLATTQETRLTDIPGLDWDPAWAPYVPPLSLRRVSAPVRAERALLRLDCAVVALQACKGRVKLFAAGRAVGSSRVNVPIGSRARVAVPLASKVRVRLARGEQLAIRAVARTRAGRAATHFTLRGTR